MRTSYAIALGSNMRSSDYGSPMEVLEAAFAALTHAPVSLVHRSRTVLSRPVGPSQRSYANAAALIDTILPPPALLAHLKEIERTFGRRRSGQKWRARVLDLDIILWSEGPWIDDSLIIPHPAFRTRDFVLRPLYAVAPKWRDPISGFTIGHLNTRKMKKSPK
jgi:2-amino-4-hydroxy-6-hydroxymethyldihydropteridine diphosphokinase